MLDLVVVMVEVGLVVRLVVVGAQLEDVRQRREQEQQELEHQLLGRADADQQRKQPHHLDLDDLDDQYDGEEREQQFSLEKFLCKVEGVRGGRDWEN